MPPSLSSPTIGCLVAATAIAAGVVSLLVALLVCLSIDLLILVLVAEAAVITAVGMFVIAVVSWTEAVAGLAVIAPVV